MKRGDIWTLQDTAYASKARPVVIVQSDEAPLFDSVILCLFTTFDSANIPTRVKIEPDEENGLTKTSYVMTDKVVTVDKAMLGYRIGKLSEEAMKHVSTQLARILGLAD